MDTMQQEQRFGTRNYHPLPVVLSRGEGSWVWDDAGKRYLDMMSAYSAVSPGHSHPRLVATLVAQAGRLAIPSRAFYNDRLGPLLQRLAELTGLDRALPMNTGAEAVETAIKAARRWGYRVKQIPANQAEIIVADGNFHGRTTTIVSFSSEEDYRQDFGPFTPGFVRVPFGDIAAMRAAITPRTAAILVEPVQGEAGIIVPPAGWLKAVRALCDEQNVLLILDEVQSGLGRTGQWFCYQHEGIKPDAVILGKALGGGLLPVSAVVGTEALMGQFTPGSHGSTFGGNPLSSAVALEALAVIADEQLVARSAILGRYLRERLAAIKSPLIRTVRGMGLWIGVDIDPALLPARALSERLAERGVLTKETHETVLRFAPPLTITRDEIDWGLAIVEEVFQEMSVQKSVQKEVQPMQKTAQEKAQGPHLVMCPPDFYNVSYVINPWMDPVAWAEHAPTLERDAREGWKKLYDTYVALGARVEVMPPVDGLPDLVFTANAAVVMNRKVLLARYLCPERQGEEAHGLQFFNSLKKDGVVDEVHEMPQGVYFEGAGDCYWDPTRQMLWTGWGQRSSREAQGVIDALFGIPSVSLELVDPRFYHLDTAFCVLSGGEVLYVPCAFTEAGRDLITSIVGSDKLITVDAADAERLAANSVSVGKDLVFGHCGDALRTTLESRGYRVHVVPLGSFGRSGGSAYCLTLRLDNQSKPA